MSAGRAVAGVALGGVAGSGALLIAYACDLQRRAGLYRRLDPYVGATGASVPPASSWAVWLSQLAGGEGDLARHLRAAGRSETPLEFRAHQAVLWVASSGAFILLVVVLRLAGAPVAAGGGVLSALLLGAAGPVLAQVRVRAAATRRRLAVELELPAVAGLLSLCMSAGETLRASLERVAWSGPGLMASELRRVVDETNAGAPLANALDGVSHRLDVTAVSRLVDALQLARDRGVPVSGVLRAQAGDLRAAATRRLLEESGKRQVWMLVPVVFLILPVCVLFAFYPALVSLRLLAR